MTTDGAAAEREPEETRHVLGEMVVDSDHASLIVDVLLKGVNASVSDAIPALGLSLVTFADAQAAIDALPAPTADFRQPDNADLMDHLIAALRSSAAALWSGWYPTMGKNRIVMGPEAEPYTSPKDDPELGPEPGPENLEFADGTRPEDGLGVTVGVLDTAAIRHPFYKDVVSFSGDSETTSAEVTEAFQAHGTFVTGLVHRNAPGAKIRVYAALSRAKARASAWESAKGMVQLVQDGANVINMSIGCTTTDNKPPFAMRAAVDRLRDRAVFVAAAGNYDRQKPGPKRQTAPSWPAALDGVLAVGSEDAECQLSFFSPDQPWVDLVTNGRDVPSTFPENQTVRYELKDGTIVEKPFCGTAIWSGTSFAAAAVAGRIATLASRSGDPDTGKTLGVLAKRLRDKSSPPDAVARRPCGW